MKTFSACRLRRPVLAEIRASKVATPDPHKESAAIELMGRNNSNRFLSKCLVEDPAAEPLHFDLG